MASKDLQRFDFGANPDTDIKVQAIRVVDVVVLGPTMVAAAYHAKRLPKLLRWFLGISGVATTVFNGVNLARAADARAARGRR